MRHEPYDLCRFSGPARVEVNEWLATVSTELLAEEEWRLATLIEVSCAKGSKTIAWKCKLPSNKGAARPQYRMLKRTKRLREASHLPGVQMGSGEFGLASSSENAKKRPIPEIMYAQSP